MFERVGPTERRERPPRYTPIPTPIPLLQRQLKVGRSDDPLEREADSVALLVSRALHSNPVDAGHDSPRAVRRVGNSPPADGGVVDASTEAQIRNVRGGTALEPRVQRQAEGVLGADLSAVRLHHGAGSRQLNEQVHAEAFTYGSQIFFRGGLPDTSTAAGRELLGHELTHTVQQSAAVHRRVQRKKRAHTPAVGLDVVDDWVAYSGGSKPKRSSHLKAIDAAVARWAAGSRQVPAYIDGNINELNAIIAASNAWAAKKNNKPSVRDIAVNALTTYVRGELAAVQARKAQNDAKLAQAQLLHDEFAKIDDETGRFAKKNTTDIQPSRYLPENQSAGLMAHIKKNADGTLTDEGMKELDDLQIAERDALIAKARGERITVDADVSPEQLRAAMAARLNPLSGQTEYPELAAVSDPTGKPPGEVTVTKTIAGSKFQVTYDPSDPNADIRLGALEAAVKLINATMATVPDLEVYFPRAGRTVEVDKACQVTVKKGIADAVFHAPAFFAVSSANVGNPKDDRSGADYKFLSTALSAADGFTTALRNSIIHELGHACHYANDRSKFYNLNFAFFSGTAADGRTYQQIATEDVSGYGNNPREMVAEVFLAAVVGGKTFSPLVWEMYKAFGGVTVI